MSTVEVTAATIRFAAMNLLAMREHSAKELITKLSQKFDSDERIVSVVERLTTDGLQSDFRFAEAFITVRKRQGKGPLLVTLELKERGVDSLLIEELVETNSVDWNRLALSAIQKKFGSSASDRNLKEKARHIRFLTSRGFSPTNIQYVFKYSRNAEDE